MRRVFVFALASALTVWPSQLSAQRGGQREGARAMYETGPMGRLGDCITDGMIVGAAAGLVFGMFQTDRTDIRVPSMLFWGFIGWGMGVIPGAGYWAVHEIRRDRAMQRERPDTITTPGPRVQASILRTRPCRGAIPFTSAPSTPAAAREGALPWVREP